MNNNKPQRPQLGEWCVVSAAAVKHRREVEGKVRTSDRDVSWERDEIDPAPMMFIGYRFVKNGRYWVDADYDDYGRSYGTPMFDTEKQLEVWVFVKGARSNPVYTFPEDVRRVGAIAS